MQEAEVSLRVALYYIMNGLTDKDVIVSIDGAHVRTGDKVHFDIQTFMSNHNCIKIDGQSDRWQGTYQFENNTPHIVIVSKPGIGDVIVWLADGHRLYVESKKGKENKSGLEYTLMREAIGQLMTSGILTEEMVPAVAVPHSCKSYELAMRWRTYPQIQQVGIRFLLVKPDGVIEMI
jgi:hypothetical protein